MLFLFADIILQDNEKESEKLLQNCQTRTPMQEHLYGKHQRLFQTCLYAMAIKASQSCLL
ncbi:hypothetical protein DOY81_004992 [Sarcophaga bullata]|nr:hypothetical protein DOY81_004992 [Sarcophaga bullata]